MVDPRRHDDLVEGRMFRPAEIAVGGLPADTAVFDIFGLGQARVDPVRRLGERRNDLHRIDVRREVAEHRRLIAGAGADFEHLVARDDIQLRSHAPDDVRPGYRYTAADIEEGMGVGPRRAAAAGKLLARGRQEGALFLVPPQIVILDHGPVAVPLRAQESRLVAPGLLHEGGKGGKVVQRRAERRIGDAAGSGRRRAGGDYRAGNPGAGEGLRPHTETGRRHEENGGNRQPDVRTHQSHETLFPCRKIAATDGRTAS